MSAIGLLAVCILGCDALLYFLFQWTYGEKHRGLARRSRSNGATGYPRHSQPLEFVSAHSLHRFAGSQHKDVGPGRENKNVTPIRRIERLAGRAAIASPSRARQ